MMNHVAGAALALPVTLALAGCDKSTYETPPVTLSTTAGTVVCQLYRPDTVMWDEAMSHPDAMSRTSADSLCRQEGHRRLQNG
jgi:hypothetical protein